MRRVIVESPYAGDVEGNQQYARLALHDCLVRGEAPFASHLLYTQRGVLDDALEPERVLGIAAGFAWWHGAEAIAFYCDRGMSSGMAGALARWASDSVYDQAVEFRFLAPPLTSEQRAADPDYYRWSPAWACTSADQLECNLPRGVFKIERLGSSAFTRQAPFRVSLNNVTVAHYATRDRAKTGGEHFYRFFRPLSVRHHGGHAILDHFGAPQK